MKLIYLLPLTLLIACNKPACTNKNPVFDKNAPGTPIYDAELTQQIKKQPAGETHYWIESYEARAGKEYMKVEVQANDMCAHVELDITGNKDLDQFRSVKGSGYSGAELKGLKLRIEESDTKYHFFFDGVDRIND